MKMELFPKNLNADHRDHFRRYAHALRFAIGLHMVPRNSTQLLKINTTTIQVEREPV